MKILVSVSGVSCGFLDESLDLREKNPALKSAIYRPWILCGASTTSASIAK
jgi:hypothetical protein